jgi:SPP1 gp7 family putative phage head morphogenesis protein
VGIEAVELTDYTKLIEKVAKQLHEGTLKPSDLNSDLLTTILGDVKGALADGYGKEFSNYTDSPAKKLQLNKHLYRFSAAKTYQELAKINLALRNNPIFSDFKKEALKVNQEYNVRYLQTEFNTANRSGAMAAKWDKIQSQKHLYPNLTYKTVKDNRVREEHRNLDEITKPVDDAFWDKWYPPNGWHCRCYVTQTDGEVTPGTPKGNPTPGFHGNVGKDSMVFNEDEHPYFIFPAEDTKKIKASFEDLKLSTPDYNVVYTNKKATLAVSTWADPKDLEANLKSAKIIVDELVINVKIRPHSDIHGVKNPEYLIEGKIGDLKEPEGYKGIKTSVKASVDQKCTVTVIDFTKHFEKLYPNQVEGRLKNYFKHKIEIEEIILIYDKKVLYLKKKDLIKIQKGEAKVLFDSWLK